MRDVMRQFYMNNIIILYINIDLYQTYEVFRSVLSITINKKLTKTQIFYAQLRNARKIRKNRWQILKTRAMARHGSPFHAPRLATPL